MKREKPISLILLMALATVLLIAVGTVAAATLTAIIDFEGLAEGAIVSSVSDGNGISGDPIGGTVAVAGHNPRLAGNAAVVFDANCDGDPNLCTGGDDDLYFPEQGKILIVAENLIDGNGDGLVDDPDDADVGGAYLSFDFSNYGPGEVTVDSLTVMDIELEEGGAHVELWGGGVLLATVPLPQTGDHQKQTVAVNVGGVDFMKVVLNGSGAIDNIQISVDEPPGGPGTRTPGYWKNHPEAWPVDSITIGGVVYTKAEAIAIMQNPTSGDKTYNMFEQLVATELNLLMGTDGSCIEDTVDAAQVWMAAHPVGSGVAANSPAWQQGGSALHSTLDAYNNGLMCAPHAD